MTTIKLFIVGIVVINAGAALFLAWYACRLASRAEMLAYRARTLASRAGVYG